MRAREAALRNFFQNVEVAVRSVDLCSSSGKWEVRGAVGARGGERCWGQGLSYRFTAVTIVGVFSAGMRDAFGHRDRHTWSRCR
jgi:hypothetical protein